jgi:hypothetical protein
MSAMGRSRPPPRTRQHVKAEAVAHQVCPAATHGGAWARRLLPSPTEMGGGAGVIATRGQATANDARSPRRRAQHAVIQHQVDPRSLHCFKS